MKARFFLAALLLTIASLLIGCKKSNEFKIHASDNGGKIEIDAGQMLVIELPSNITTGFSWGVYSVDAQVLAQEGDPQYVDGGNSQATGAGGLETFRFTALAAGETKLELGYRQPWETDVAPIETFLLTVVVK